MSDRFLTTIIYSHNMITHSIHIHSKKVKSMHVLCNHPLWTITSTGSTNPTGLLYYLVVTVCLSSILHVILKFKFELKTACAIQLIIELWKIKCGDHHATLALHIDGISKKIIILMAHWSI
jgi:hypothetical protein